MFNVCPGCGMYSEEKIIRPGVGESAEAVCPTCGYAHLFLRLPLYVITGASGTGKSTLVLKLAAEDRTRVHLESDILWRNEFNRPGDNYRDYRNLWLRMVKNIAQGGRSVVLYGSVGPNQFENCPERRYIETIHYLALICEGEELARRLRARPSWRGTRGDSFVKGMLNFNRWFIENAAFHQPPITLLDTTHASTDETASSVRSWLDKF